jgi:hypothetical protein
MLNKQKGKIPRMKHSIELTPEQREQLEEVISKGNAAARKIRHAQILLKIDSGGMYLNHPANSATFFGAWHR